MDRHMRILRPNGQWITESLAENGLRFESVEAAVRYARRFANITNDYGRFLIYDGDQDTPVATMTMERLVEDD